MERVKNLPKVTPPGCWVSSIDPPLTILSPSLPRSSLGQNTSVGSVLSGSWESLAQGDTTGGRGGGPGTPQAPFLPC